jgi:hypothetical protein
VGIPYLRTLIPSIMFLICSQTAMRRRATFVADPWSARIERRRRVDLPDRLVVDQVTAARLF